jgi:hypothetical protein
MRVADGSFWHFSTDPGSAASRQQLGLDRTSQTFWFDAIDPSLQFDNQFCCDAQRSIPTTMW